MGGRGRIATLAALAAALAFAAPAAAQLPVVPHITASPVSPGNATHVTWSFDGDALTQCRLVDPDPDEEVWALCPPGDSSFDLGAGDGTYAFEVSSTGLSADDSSVYVLDTTPPAAPAITGGPSGTTANDSPSFSFEAAEPITQCRLDRGGVLHDWSPCTSPWTYGLSTEPDGAYEFLVRTRDAAGNTSPAASRTFTLDRSPLPAVPAPESAPTPLPPAPAPESVPTSLRPGVCINLFSGTGASETLTGSAFGDVLVGHSGDDLLSGRGGDDCVLGDAGNDVLTGGGGNDDVRGYAGNDTVAGGPGTDRVAGGGGSDVVLGGGGDDAVAGGPGFDRLVGGAGTDSFVAGRGNDTVITRDGRPETVDCGTGRDRLKADRSDRARKCERRTPKASPKAQPEG